MSDAAADPAVTDALVGLGTRMGHAAVETRGTPGFLANQAGRVYGTGALRVVGEAVAEPASVDRVLVQQAGFRMGPFELLDLIGIDVSPSVMGSIYGQFFHETRFRLSALPRQYVAAGLPGRKTGRGFCRYADGKPVVDPEPEVPAAGKWVGCFGPTEPCAGSDPAGMKTRARSQERGRLGWQRAVHDGRRSPVEAAMLRYKVLIGRRLRARTPPARRVEAGVGCKVMNVMTSLGMPVTRKVA